MSSNPFDQPLRPEQPVQGVAGQQTADPLLGGSSVPAAVPAIDLVDGAESISVYVDLPGYEEEEIEVRGDETALVVSAQRMAELDDATSILVHERPTRIERHIQLPAPVDIDKAEADYDEGVCTISLPKSAAERYKRIDLR